MKASFHSLEIERLKVKFICSRDVYEWVKITHTRGKEKKEKKERKKGKLPELILEGCERGIFLSTVNHCITSS